MYMDYGSFGGGYNRMPQMGQERMAPVGEMMFVDGAHQLYGMRTIPGADKVFFDKEEDVFYVVCTNHYGQPQIKAYCFEEIQGPESSSQYVTKQELRDLMQEFLGGKGGGGHDQQSLQDQ
jgi:hypothetical protein